MDKSGEELDKAIGKSLEDTEFFISMMQDVMADYFKRGIKPIAEDMMIQHLLDTTQLLLRKALEK